jgi:AraC family transcriptional regulator
MQLHSTTDQIFPFDGARMKTSFSDDPINTSNQDIPTTIPSLIDAAVEAFDSDRETSRRYLLRASALLSAKHGVRRRSPSRSGLLAWQLDCVVDHIETHLADKITAMELANLIEVSMGHLFRSFKISVGVTPFHYITLRRVELACTMMRTTREPLSQLALACGLCDQAHLSRVFRRIMGMTPSAWRRAITCGVRLRPVPPGRNARCGPVSRRRRNL